MRLLARTEVSLKEDDHRLNRLRSAIIRSTRAATLSQNHIKLRELAKEMGYSQPKTANKEKMLKSIQHYKRQNAFLYYSAVSQAIINTCVIYEDFIRTILMKYYEEDIRRLISEKESLKNKQIIDTILRGDNLHRSMAQKTVDDLMYGSLDSWHFVLNKIGMDITNPALVQELFLVRNCVVHNNKRVSYFLHYAFPDKYNPKEQIRLTTRDVEMFKDATHRLAVYIMLEYNRLFPTNKGTWV